MSEPTDNTQPAPTPLPPEPPPAPAPLRREAEPGPRPSLPPRPQEASSASRTVSSIWQYPDALECASVARRPADLLPPVLHYDVCGSGPDVSPLQDAALTAGPGAVLYSTVSCIRAWPWVYDVPCPQGAAQGRGRDPEASAGNPGAGPSDRPGRAGPGSPA